ncbi:hypothetical protein [uncultured Chitinophaga sp.]|jgi:hypothetical protein|uniref:hypothetical protein n=1 Tax=uncultured Chitinophaga sp. TaxID=339340 RepID=UPI0026354B79|nr:hypothetical protein [uncultured Chitinophaga sp.]
MEIKRYRRLGTILAAVTLLACNPGGSRQVDSAAHSDLKAYFTAEAIQMAQSGLQMQKTVALNGQRDSINQPLTDTLALQHLLKPFLDVDINKPSLRDAYRTDTVKDLFTGSSAIMYAARHTSVNPQQIILNFDSTGQISSVNINKRTSNLVYQYQQNLFYQHLKTIRITTRQKIAFLQARELDVRVSLAPKN